VAGGMKEVFLKGYRRRLHLFAALD